MANCFSINTSILKSPLEKKQAAHSSVTQRKVATHQLRNTDCIEHLLGLRFLLPLVLFLHGGFGHLALQDLLPLFVHVALHPGKGVVPDLTQVRLQALLLRIVCANDLAKKESLTFLLCRKVRAPTVLQLYIVALILI